jgi:hypothetical protein
MTTFPRRLPALLAAPLLASALASGLGQPAQAYPRPVGVAPYERTPNPWAYGDSYSDGYGDDGYGPAQPLPPQARQPLTPLQLAQRCNTGRLVGGLVGGGLGYAVSRQDGRAWAVPLGALLGSQMGCSTAAGRGPALW